MSNGVMKSLYSEEGNLLFMHVRIENDKTEFVTDDEFLLQVGHLVFPEGNLVRKHRHALIDRQIPYTAEVLIICSGRLEFQVWEYDEPEKMIEHGVGMPGDVLIFGMVAHSFKSLSLTKVIEVKQGPYLGQLDKQFGDVCCSLEGIAK